MNVTYVSALYNIYDSSSVSTRLLNDVNIMLKQNAPYFICWWFLLWYDTNNIQEWFRNDCKTTYWRFTYIQYIYLPCERSEEKDTHEYMALMNSKPEFLYRALLMIDTKYIAWIDAGVAKMFKNKDEEIKLQHI